MTNYFPELLALAARCEVAPGPSLNLDRSVHEALQRLPGYDTVEDVGRSSLKRRLWVGRPYTGSVAAALAPVPTGSWWEASSEGEGYKAWVRHSHHIGRATARTVPLAVLAAALGALAAYIEAQDEQWVDLG
jgi:hypothetical protein